MDVNHNCNLCGGGRFELIGELDRHGAPLSTVICRNCGLVSHAYVPTDEELANYYRELYRLEYNSEETPSRKRVVREWRRGCERFQLLRAQLKPGDRILEIGSGIGCNLKQFELAGHDTLGIEPGVGFADYSRTTLHCNVVTTVFDNLGFSREFDFVLLIHVLEHLPRPAETLRRIAGYLREGGRLYIEVPNLAGPHAAPDRLFHSAHIYNFTPATLASLATSCGFEVLARPFEDSDRNLGMVLERDDTVKPRIDCQAYEETLRILRRSRIAYYARTRYLRHTWERYSERILERVRGQQQYEQILRTCRQKRAA